MQLRSEMIEFYHDKNASQRSFSIMGVFADSLGYNYHNFVGQDRVSKLLACTGTGVDPKNVNFLKGLSCIQK